MVPRLRFDISWRDLAHAARLCCTSKASGTMCLGEVTEAEAVATLSVRSAFDLLLNALELPAGSEVLFSEITVPHMPRIAREHGLEPIALPVDPRTLGVEVEAVARRLTPRTRMVVVAHLFGARMQLDALGQLVGNRGILLVEDCAQALVSDSLPRHPVADASLYSFGPIKTATAAGGGVAIVKDGDLRDRMAKLAEGWPRQSSGEYFGKVTKLGLLKFMSQPMWLTLLVAAIGALGGDADQLVGGSARGFADEKLFLHLRKQPCDALVAMIAFRLARFDERRIVERTRRGEILASQLGPAAFVAGCDNRTHTYWVFPMVCENPERVRTALRAVGFDASQRSGLFVVESDDPSHWFRSTVFVPHHEGISDRRLQAAAEIIRTMG